MLQRLKGLCSFVCVLLVYCCSSIAASDLNSPVGVWQTIDDETHKPRSIVQIFAVDGELQGKLLKVFYSSDEVHHMVCEKCGGERHNQPIIGMIILRGMVQQGDNWAGGIITDPGNGKDYNCRIKLLNGGKQLKVRGYIAVPLIGRSQIWNRIQ